RIVIVGRNRVVLVIVAAGAGDGDAEQATADSIDLIIDIIVAVIEFAAGGQKAKSREAHLVLFGGRELVGGELIEHEFVVGPILVQGADDVVAVSVSIGIAPLLLEGV